MNEVPPNVDSLRQLYSETVVAKAFFDHARLRQRDRSETKVKGVLKILRRDGYDCSRQQIVELFRKLEEFGCGQFVVGRHGWPSRFVWSVGLKSMGTAAAGGPDQLSRISEEDSTDDAATNRKVEDIYDDSDAAAGEETGEVGGTGLEEEKEEDEDLPRIVEPFDPRRIRVETKTMVISLLLERIRRGEIDLAPGFQRKGGIWSKKAKSQLIESMLIRIPLPAFYMDGSDEGRWLVVDGLQRLSTLKAFAVDETLALKGLEFLTTYEGKTFHDLPRDLQRRIQETQVTVFLIQENTPPEVKFNIFKRINTGGLPLSSQEIRHALHQGPATDLLQELSESAEFQIATKRGIRDDRMGDRECILRLLAFMRTPYRDYDSGNLDTFLNECMDGINAMSPEALNELRNRFKKSMDACYKIFGDRAFRKQSRESGRRYPINRALFEAWGANIEVLGPADIEILAGEDILIENFITLLDDSEFASAISYGTGDPRKVRLRFSKIEGIIQEVLQ